MRTDELEHPGISVLEETPGPTYLVLTRYPDARTDPSIDIDRFSGGFERELGVGGEDEVVFLGDDVFVKGGHIGEVSGISGISGWYGWCGRYECKSRMIV
jgi:hypothetical protein